MRVNVKFAGPLRDVAGVRGTVVELVSEGTTGDALQEIGRQFPGIHRELFGQDPKGYYSIFINEKLVVETERMTTPLKDGDQMLLLLPIAGG